MNHVSPSHSPMATPASTGRPTAVGMVRLEISGRHTAAYALEIQCQAHHLGYRCICTLRLPEGTVHPVEYTLANAVGMDADAIIVPDLTHVDEQPERITADVDLVTIAPARIWRWGGAKPDVVDLFPLNDCTWEPAQLEPDCARRLWHAHRDCFPDCLSRLAARAALSAVGERDR